MSLFYTYIYYILNRNSFETSKLPNQTYKLKIKFQTWIYQKRHSCSPDLFSWRDDSCALFGIISQCRRRLCVLGSLISILFSLSAIYMVTEFLDCRLLPFLYKFSLQNAESSLAHLKKTWLSSADVSFWIQNSVSQAFN